MNNNLVISLGHNCYVSWTIRKVGLQKVSYPLDWVNSFNLRGVIDFFKAGSADFINELTNSSATNEGDDKKILFSEKYQFRLPHEYDKDPSKSLTAIYDMYKRRIERFFEHCSDSHGVIFIRNINRKPYKSVPPENLQDLNNEAKEFCKLIEQRIGHGNFIVIFTTYDDISLEFTDSKCFFINKVLPFENGFFEYDNTKLNGSEFFGFNKKFLSSLSQADVAELDEDKITSLYLNSFENLK